MESIKEYTLCKPVSFKFANLALRVTIFVVHISTLSSLVISNHQKRHVIMPNKSATSRICIKSFPLDQQVLKTGGKGCTTFGSAKSRLRTLVAALSVARTQGGCPEAAGDIHDIRSDDTFDHDELRCAQKWRRREVVRIAKFGLPALSITLADPLMSFVDAVCIGRGGTTLEVLGRCAKLWHHAPLLRVVPSHTA